MADTTPTWQFVQEIISSNIDKAELAASAAERGLNELKSQVTDFPFTPVSASSSVSEAWTATITPQTPPDEPDYSAVSYPTISNPALDLPEVTLPDQPTFTDAGGTMPTMGAKLFDGTTPAAATTTDIGFDPPTALPDLGDMKALIHDEDQTFGPDSTLGTALGTFATSVGAASNTSVNHPWGGAWETSAYATMSSRADAIRTQLNTILTDPTTQGLPSAYWDQLATEAAARIARKKAGALRRATNGGAPSYWGLPTEAVLALTRQADQDALEEYQTIEGEIVKKRTELVREAWFKAIDVLVDMERWMVATALAVRKQAVDIFNQLWSMRVAMYNANVAQFKYAFDKVAMNIEAITADNKVALEAWASRLRAMEALLKADETTAQIFNAEVSGYKVLRETHYQGIDAQVRHWAATIDGLTKLEALKIDKVKIDVDHFRAVVDKVQGVAQATAALLNARTQALGPQTEAEKALVALETAKNNVLVEEERLNQQAKQTNAALESEQAKFVSGQTTAILQSIAASYVGIYQALLQISDVNLSSGWSGSSSISASKNAAKVWD